MFGGGFQQSMIQSINPDIFAANCGGATNGWRFTGLTWPSGGSAFSLQPALPHTVHSDSQTFFVNTFSGSGNKALLWKLGGSRVSSPSLTRAEIPINSYYAIGNNVSQPGTTTRIDGGDARVMNAVYANRRVFFTLTSDAFNDASRAGWLTARLNIDSNTREWQHLLYGDSGFYYFYPAITIQGTGENNHLALFGSWTDAETAVTPGTFFASGLVKFYENQPTDATGAFFNLVSGLGTYNRVFSGRNRWGDYSGAAYDWWTGHAWGSVEWANNNNTWATTISGRGFGSEATTRQLTVSKAGLGVGTVTSSPSGINCGTTCSAFFSSGSTVRLTAAPAAGSTFGGWAGACTGFSTTCDVVLNNAASATATFNRINYTLTVTKAGTGSGTVTSNPSGINCGATCSASYPSGTAVTLSAAPASGSIFSGWGGACSGTATTCVVSMSAARAVSATFNLSIVPSGFTIGLHNPATSTFYLRNSNSAGPANTVFGFGPGGSGWRPLTGDWNANGQMTVGLYNPATSGFFLRNSNSGGAADVSFGFGPAAAGWRPLTGDWNGNGQTTVGLFNPATSTFYLRNSNSGGTANVVFGFGPSAAGWVPLTGDWNGDGATTIGLYNPATSTFYLRNTNSGGAANVAFGFGPAGAGWLPLTGDWNGNGQTTVGLFNPATSTFYLRNTNSGGGADVLFSFGPGGAGWAPLTGKWVP